MLVTIWLIGDRWSVFLDASITQCEVLCNYFFISILAQNVVVFPSRAVAIENALRLFSPRLAIVDEHLTRHLPRQWLTSLVIEVCWFVMLAFFFFFFKF
jgi:hypothetical protein